MKCPICDGTGEVANYHKIDFDEPTEPMTNGEWFCGLSTTKKSEFLAMMVTEAIKEHGKCGTTRRESVIWWDEWLKQPHTNKE